MNKKTIFNDPVYGFITIPYPIVFDLIEHPYFQRLRKIVQLGLSSYVYPGALHTRFQHAIGAMHLMGLALEVLRSKGHEISEEEAKAATIAILLHDIGHGPFSHTLEQSIVANVHHEYLSELIMSKLNEQFGKQLSFAIKIFKNQYRKKYLHQLVSSQLDMDRMDYLNRDSFFTGVHEGVIGYDRIIKMLEVHKDELVVEAKGIYSIEKFLISRRLMYWQVYLHKTVLSAEQMLVRTLLRAKELAQNGKKLFATQSLKIFLYNDVTKKDFEKDGEALKYFTQLDDFDIYVALKAWAVHPDKILSALSSQLVNRKLFKCELQPHPFEKKLLNYHKEKAARKYKISMQDADYFVFQEITSNNLYDREADNIKILFKDGKLMDIAEASDQMNISVLDKPTVKYFLCYPKDI